MTTERWRQLKELFGEVCERPPEKRRAFIDSACGGDEELRAELMALVDSHAASAEFLKPPRRRAAAGSHAEVEDLAGRRIGPYEVLRPLGAGGMGAVYLARRGAEEVALKLVKRGMDTNLILSRFQNERRALENLVHPNIARLLDAGAADDGRPYLVMEYVEGERIDRWCDRKRLSIPDRLELFRKVCAAVHYAHQNLVVHRDLKPSNILITEQGAPKLLDFGLAKVLDPDVGDHATITATAHRFLTPEYAAPEQINGDPITIAADVYSLGVVLYELLCGRRPYRLQARSQAEIERVVLEFEPAALSAMVGRDEQSSVRDDASRKKINPVEIASARRATPERLRRRLSGDLDTIALTTLRKEPERRYKSVEQLNEEIYRALHGLPIRARKDTAVYRLTKFIQRNKGAVGVGAALAATLFIGAGVALWQARIATEKRIEAARADVKAERMRAYLLNTFQAADPGALGASVTLDELLDISSDRIASELGDEPEVRAQMLDNFGRIYFTHGRFDAAVRNLSDALALYRQAPGDHDLDVANTLHMLGAVLLEAGRFEEAKQRLSEAVDARRRVRGAADNRVAGVLDDLRRVHEKTGDYATAERLYEEAGEIYRNSFGADDLFMATRRAVLGDIRIGQGRFDEAEAIYERAIAEVSERFGDDPVYIADLKAGRARAIHQRGDIERAAAALREAAELQRAAYNGDHPELARTLSLLARNCAARGEIRQADEILAHTVRMQRDLLGDDHPRLQADIELLGRLRSMPPTESEESHGRDPGAG